MNDHPRVQVSRMSYGSLPAKDVFRLSMASIEEIRTNRERAKRARWEFLKNETRRTFFGKEVPLFESREEAELVDQGMRDADGLGWGDLATSKMLADFSKAVMDLTGPDSLMQISADDYRAIS